MPWIWKVTLSLTGTALILGAFWLIILDLFGLSSNLIPWFDAINVWVFWTANVVFLILGLLCWYIGEADDN